MDKLEKTHVGYVLFILCSVIIGLITVRWGQITDLVSYITFALTITSIALAVLAIVYAYLSNASLNQTITKLDAASQAVGKTAAKVVRATTTLEKKVTLLPEILSDVRSQVEKTHTVIESIASARQASVPTVPQPRLSDAFIDQFVFTSSISGLLALKLFGTLYPSHPQFNSTVVSQNVPFFEYHYMHGFSVGASAAGVSQVGVDGDKWIVEEFDDRLRSRIQPQLDTRIAHLVAEKKTHLAERTSQAIQAINRALDWIDAAPAVVPPNTPTTE